MITPVEYKEFVRSMMTDYDHDHNFLHFTSGIITEFTEYLQELDTDEPTPEGTRHELGDVLFYSYAASIELLDLRDRFVNDPEECEDEKIYMGAGRNEGIAEFDLFHRLLATGYFVRVTTDFEDPPHSDAWLFAKPLEHIQKWCYQGRALYLIELMESLTACLNLIAGFCRRENTTLLECMAQNVAKLQKRHPDGFRGVSWKNDGPAGG